MEENKTTDNVTSSGSAAISPLDPFLQFFVGIANKGDNVELNITLHVSGFLVSGTLVSRRKYLDGFIADFTRGMDEPTAAEVRERLLELTAPTEQDMPPLPAEFIHLRDARFFHPSGEPIPKNQPVWWRGRLSAIAAFTLGSLSRD
jgi:hypothetical protein